MTRNLFLGCGLALLSTACLSGSDDPADADQDGGPAFATSLTLQQMLVGKTTFGNYVVDGSYRDAFCEYFAPDGTASRVELIGESREIRTGTYTLEDDQVCVAYLGAPECWQVEAQQSSTASHVWGGDFYTPDGTVESHVVTAEGNQVERCH